MRTEALRPEERRELFVPRLRRRELLDRELRVEARLDRFDPELRVEERCDRLDPELRLRRELPDSELRRVRRDDVPDARRDAERLRPEERRAPRDCDRVLRELASRALPRARPRPCLRPPSSAAFAVSRDTSLLKLLFWPPAVSSCTRSARLRSLNLLNQSSHDISSSEFSPV
ncbi:MAG TPA: hypothetical protein VE994_01405 [Terriglobales bacterium]|nr:hypothetical protein [Terriglobales bacterium]